MHVSSNSPASPTVKTTTREGGTVDVVEKLFEAWKKQVKHKDLTNFASDLDYHALKLSRDISRELGSPNFRGQLLKQITEFLRDEQGENGIDSCVRWLILFNISQPPPGGGGADESKSQQGQIRLVQIIADMEPYLPFENPHYPTNVGTNDIKKSCTRPKLHWQYRKKPSTPFNEAAKWGNIHLIRSMIEHLGKYCEKQKNVNPEERRLFLQSPSQSSKELLWHVLRKKVEVEDRRKISALEQARIGYEKPNLDTLAELLKYAGVEGLPDTDETFMSAVNDGAVGVVEQFLQSDGMCKHFVTSKNIIEAIKKLQKNDGDRGNQDVPRGCREEVVHTLVKKAKTAEVFTTEVAQKIIELNLDKVWKARDENVDMQNSCLLHLAVYYQRSSFVKIFLDAYPSTLLKKALVPVTGQLGDNTDGYYPLWYNNKQWEGPSGWVDRKPSPEIRRLLVSATIKQSKKMHSLSEIFRESAGKCLPDF